MKLAMEQQGRERDKDIFHIEREHLLRSIQDRDAEIMRLKFVNLKLGDQIVNLEKENKNLEIENKDKDQKLKKKWIKLPTYNMVEQKVFYPHHLTYILV